MMTTLITLICVILALAIFAGAFYLAKYTVSLQHRVNVLEDSYTAANEHIQKQEELITQLTQQIDMMERENKLTAERPERSRAWNPRDIMNVRDR